MGRVVGRWFAAGLVVVLAVPITLGVRAEPAAAALPPVSAIGDSTLLGMTASSRAIVSGSYSFLWEAKSCRRLIITSCRGRGVIPPNTIQTMQAYAGQLGDAVAIMAGYDDWYNFDLAVDTIVAEARRQGIGHVIWLTYRSQGPYVGIGGAYFATYRAFNAILAAKARQHPELTIADWDTYTLGRSSWFSSDGIHLSSSGATALGTFLKLQYDALGLQKCYGPRNGTPIAPPAPVAITQAAPGGFTAGAKRVLDTRPGGADPLGAPIAAGAALGMPLVAQGLVPADTTSVLVNVTAVGACGAGFLTAYPCGAQVPFASNLNVPIRRTRAALATVMLNAQGELCVYSSTTTDVLVDLLGSFGPGGLGLNPVAPDRLLDTRTGNGARIAQVGKVGPATFAAQIAGVGVVPAGATAVLLNVTAVGPDWDGYLTVHRCGAVPDSSNLNFRAGQVLANLVVTALDASGRGCFTPNGPTNLVVDVLGWFGPTGLRVRAQTPQRVVDTRSGLGGVVGPVGAGANVAMALGGAPTLATVTIVNPGAPGFATAYPCGPQPTASNLNYVAGDVMPNQVMMAPGNGGNGCVYTSASAHVLVDRSATLVP